MPYFTEVNDYKTYSGQVDDFHFSYNVNSGGGQSFLGGKFRNENGNVESASVLNGMVGVFRFRITDADGVQRSVSLEDEETKYEIKPRASGDNNMKLGVDDKKTPSVAIAAFLMLPKPCGVKRADHIDISPLCSKNYWLQSMWMSVDKTSPQIATLIPKDCVFSGGVDRSGSGRLRHFKVDFAKRMADIIAVAQSSGLDREILDCVSWFADVYEGRKRFDCDDAISAIEDVMKFLQGKYPDRYSGLMDPLPVITELADLKTETPQPKDIDLLANALRAFARNRADGSWSAGYYETNSGTRDYYAKLSEGISTLDVAKVEEMFLGVKDATGDVVFQPMWSGSNGKGWAHVKKGLSEDPEAAIDAIRKYHDDASAVCAFTQKGFARPSGFGDSVVSELLMKFHPDVAIKCGKKTIDVLKKLNLMSFKHDGTYDGWEYRQVLGIATDIKLRMDEMGITRTLEDNDAADYITVNEFIAWCHSNYDLIIREWSKCMKKVIKLDNQKKDVKFKDFVEAFATSTKEANLKYDANLIKRFVCALMAKPFVVLTGLSGSGKTKLAEAFTEWIGTEDMVKVVPVGADWTNNEKMLGYPNALDGTKYVLSDTGILKFLLDARDNKDVPFFLVLDEMNLSHVERYFADFLSAMESGKKIHLYDGDARMSNNGIPIPAELEIPKNLFVIGTMNVDETTYMFSPKVLDRAQVIEFRVSEKEMSDFLAAPTYPNMGAFNSKGVIYAKAFLEMSQKRGEKKVGGDAGTELQEILKAVFPELAKLGSEFAYRCAIEVVTFVAYYLDASGYEAGSDAKKKKAYGVAAIDAAMLQKLLPKLHGSLNRLGPAIDVMMEKFSKKDDDGKGGEMTTPIYPLSYDKLKRMKDRLEANGFTSYAEA